VSAPNYRTDEISDFWSGLTTPSVFLSVATAEAIPELNFLMLKFLWLPLSFLRLTCISNNTDL